jgi:hypothetical protein
MSEQACANLRRQVSMLPKLVLNNALQAEGEPIASRYSLRQSSAVAKLGLDVGAVEFTPNTVFNTTFLGHSAITLHGIEVPDQVVEDRRMPRGRRKIEGTHRDAYRDELMRLNSPVRVINLDVQEVPEEPQQVVVLFEPDSPVRAVYENDAVQAHIWARLGGEYRFDTRLLPIIERAFGGSTVETLSEDDCAALGRAITLTPAHVPLRNFDQ